MSNSYVMLGKETENIHTLGDRMKEYENISTNKNFIRGDIVIARLDGKNFSNFTKSLKCENAFHEGFSQLMCEVTKYLVDTYNAVIGYTQSDEITLVFINNATSQHPFGGKLFKMQSIIAADTSTLFTSLLPKFIPEKEKNRPLFDCRVFSLPSLEEAYNCLIWRRLDGYRNAVSAVARKYYSTNQLYSKNRAQQIEMLKEKNVDFDGDYHIKYKFGTFYRRVTEYMKFTTDELDRLPSKHIARTNPDLQIKRHVVNEIIFEDVYNFISTCHSAEIANNTLQQ